MKRENPRNKDHGNSFVNFSCIDRVCRLYTRESRQHNDAANTNDDDNHAGHHGGNGVPGVVDQQ